MCNDAQIFGDMSAQYKHVVQNLMRQGIARAVETQRAVFEGTSYTTNILTKAQEEARKAGREFEPDLERAEEQAEANLRTGVGHRLTGAYACYRADMQLECLRHILLALGTICHTLNWDKASAYLNEQNRILLEMSNRELERM